MVCTSIGLAVKGVPVIGVIYNPFLNQLVSFTEFPDAPVTSQAEHTVFRCQRPWSMVERGTAIASYGEG
jgi:myo-inositol-1(or 4)-monophosphatase